MSNALEDNIISTYTKQDAIDDGIFIDITEQASKAGFKIPVAITKNLFSTFISSAKSDEVEAEADTNKRLDVFLKQMYQECLTANRNNSILTAKIYLDNKRAVVWAVIEGTSPSDPRPTITIMLPEDY